LFSTAAVVFDEVVPALLGGFFATTFLALAIADLERRVLPNRIVYPAIIVAVAASWVWPDSSMWEVLAGGLVAFGIVAVLMLIAVPFGAHAIGMGDIKMILLMGFVAGSPAILVGVFIGTLATAAVAALLLVTRARRLGDYIPHGPSLALGAIVALFWGDEIWDAYRG
jgi:leader peptidase (prepilin peptidase)/N-methyltransferase